MAFIWVIVFLCLRGLRIFFTTINCQLKKIKMKIQLRLQKKSLSTLSEGRKQLCVKDGKLTLEAFIRLSSTVQKYCLAPPVIWLATSEVQISLQLYILNIQATLFWNRGQDNHLLITCLALHNYEQDDSISVPPFSEFILPLSHLL